MNNQDVLKKALREIYINQSTELIQTGAEKWIYTKEYHYEEKMHRLIAKQKSSYWKHTNTYAKRLLIIAAVLIVILSSAMTVPAVRGPVIDFIVTKYEEFSLYFAKDTENASFPDEIEKVYTPQYIPNGFELAHTFSNEATITFLWKNSVTSETITFVQNVIFLHSNLNTEKSQTAEKVINGKDICIYSYAGNTSYLWSEYGYSFRLDVTAEISEDEIIKIIENIK